MLERSLKRGIRRDRTERMKTRARRKIETLGWRNDPRHVGVITSTHGRPCSCWLCQPGREVPPPRERAFYPYPTEMASLVRLVEERHKAIDNEVDGEWKMGAESAR